MMNSRTTISFVYRDQQGRILPSAPKGKATTSKKIAAKKTTTKVSKISKTKAVKKKNATVKRTVKKGRK